MHLYYTTRKLKGVAEHVYKGTNFWYIYRVLNRNVYRDVGHGHRSLSHDQSSHHKEFQPKGYRPEKELVSMTCSVGYGQHCPACELSPACQEQPLIKYEVTDYKGNSYIVEARDNQDAKRIVLKQNGKGASYYNMQGMRARKLQ
jgi:hypothetical protein